MPADPLRRAVLVAALLAATVLGGAALTSGQYADDRSVSAPAAGIDACPCDGHAGGGVDARQRQPTPNLTPTPTPTSTATPTPTPTRTFTSDETESPTPTPTPETPALTSSPSATPTSAPPSSATPTSAPPSSPTPTPTPNATPTNGETPSPTPDQPAATETPTSVATSDDDGAGESPVLIGVGGLVVVGAAALALREFQR